MPDFATQTQVTVGEATKATAINTGMDNDDNLNARVALVEGSVGIPNGSFEFPIGGGLEADGWTATNTSTGSHSVDITTIIDGAQSFKAVADAGGGFVTLLNDTFNVIGGTGDIVFVRGSLRATNVSARIRGEIKYYDEDQVILTTDTYLDTDITPLTAINTWERFRGWSFAPSGARYWKPNFILGDGADAADIYLDGVYSQVNDPFEWVHLAEAIFLTLVASSGGTTEEKVPILGRAYAARCRSDIPAGHDFQFKGYLADTDAVSTTGGIFPYEPTWNPNAYDDVNRVLEIQCTDLGGVTYIYDHPDPGTLNAYYNAWR